MSFYGGLLMLVLVTNVVLDQFLGLCEATRDPGSPGSTALFALVMTVVTVLTTVINWILHLIVLEPLGITFLAPLIFVLVNLGVVTALSVLAARAVPVHAALLGDHLVRIGSNSLVLGVAIIATLAGGSLVSVVGVALGGGVGFFLVTILLTGIQQQLRIADIPEAFRGVPITFITVGLMALAFLAFDLLVLQNIVG